MIMKFEIGDLVEWGKDFGIIIFIEDEDYLPYLVKFYYWEGKRSLNVLFHVFENEIRKIN